MRDIEAESSARIRLTRTQGWALAGFAAALALAVGLAPGATGEMVYLMLWGLFAGNAVLRLAAALTPLTGGKTPYLHPGLLPRYTVIVALYHEAGIAAQVLAAMLALRYPKDRLDIVFALETDDAETIDALRGLDLPEHVRLSLTPPGFPRTKPRALNYALAEARGDLVVVYDAEDRPDPGQLLEAARAFAAGSPRLICLQAPLRPVGGQGFIARQFAAEYAVQFDVILPAMARIGLPFPLGGTSNHFRVEPLKKLGGWDAHNVTEDADLGVRLAAAGYESGLLRSPTSETPTGCSRSWLPQRTRWIKGYMQTLLVHTRVKRSARVWAGLGLGVGMSVLAALAYAPLSVMMLATLTLYSLQALCDPARPVMAPGLADLLLFVLGNAAALCALVVGQRRAGLRVRIGDLATAPFYWSLQTLAAVFALYQLFARPFHWDKTEHKPVAAPGCQGLPAVDER
ncbi:MAG TPA: glycosyltransferase family 2 protein [Asticcacaulis sp.]|nr:glycosyltransferase family 2 protein [Asticcacaulis sp.]